MILPMMLQSCSHDDESWPSLQADDRWDQMDEERKSPLPRQEVSPTGGESQSDQDEMPIDVSRQNLTVAEIDSQWSTLTSAQKKYQTISTDMGAAFQDLAKATSQREDIWRTLQLHLSRLENLKSNVGRAIGSLTGREGLTSENLKILKDSRTLLVDLEKKAESAHKRLAELSS